MLCHFLCIYFILYIYTAVQEFGVRKIFWSKGAFKKIGISNVTEN